MGTINQRMEGQKHLLNSYLQDINPHLVTVKGWWSMDGRFGCEIYNRSTRKRIRIRLDILQDDRHYLINPIKFVKDHLAVNGSWNKLLTK